MKAKFNKRHTQAPVVFAASFALASGLCGQEGAAEAVVPGGAEASASALNAGQIYELDPFTVVAERFGEVGDFSLQSIQVLEAGELERQLEATLGETLAWEPGLNASYFGPGASRPVIRGLGDYRVRMLVDDIGTLDVSDNSPDHGVPLEPLLVRRVDIHRGPDALIFGNTAIGGAINSQTRYLPDDLPEKAVSGAVETRYETGSDGRSAAAYGTARVGDVALRVTGARRRAGDYAIAGRARSDAYEETFSPEVNNPTSNLSEPVPNPEGTVPNTSIDTQTASVGGVWKPASGRGRLGVAYSRYESSYGVPYQFGGDANELFGDTGLDMRQSRLDAEAVLELDLKPFERLRFRLGRADYSHEEIFTGRAKDAGKVFEDTTMGLDSTEARLDFYHRLFDGLEGVAGFHGFERELEVTRLTAPPDEASRSENRFDTRNLGAFLVETWTLSEWTLRGGYRYEQQTIEDRSLADFGIIREAREASHSLAFGVTWRDDERWGLDEVALTASASRIERLPSETERYAFWENAAIQRFIIGADNAGTPLGVERSNAVELGFEMHKGDWSGRLNVYRYDFADFIFLQDRKGIGNLAQFVAKEALFQGGEAELTWRVHEDANSTFRLKGMVDWVRGENQSDGTYLPRIPPLRIGSRVEYERDAWRMGAELRYAFAQERVQEASDVVLPELETDGYLEANLDLRRSWALGGNKLTLFARLKNLFDAERRTHPSFLKDVAPLPGRSVNLGARWSF